MPVVTLLTFWWARLWILWLAHYVPGIGVWMDLPGRPPKPHLRVCQQLRDAKEMWHVPYLVSHVDLDFQVFGELPHCIMSAHVS